ncbi:MAG TPA: PAS domain S-box protein [Actinomycetota bacterium]|nr:PAS domain S-box protein [Actinomycetota bacterium]
MAEPHDRAQLELEWLRLVHEQLPAMMWSVDRNMIITSSFGAGLRALGLRPDELVGVPLDVYLGGEEHPGMRAHRAAYEGESQTVEVDLGGRRLFGRVEPLRDSWGEIQGCIGLALDVTEVRQAELGLRQAVSRYELAIRASNDAIWDWNVTSGVIERSDQMKQFGYEPGSAEPGPAWWSGRVHPADRARVEGSLRHALDGGSETWEESYRFLRADGSYAEVVDRAAILRDDEGRPIRVVGSMSDISDRIRFENELAARARQQEAVARLGLRALQGVDAEDLMQEAVAEVSAALGAEFVKVLELLPTGDELVVKAAVGWDMAKVGAARVPLDPSTQSGRAVAREEVVVTERFSEGAVAGPLLETPQEVRSGISVFIPSRALPYGVLGAYTVDERSFSSDDISFLQAVANVIGALVERDRTARLLVEREGRFEALMAQSSDAVLVAGPDGMIRYATPPVERILGLHAARIVGTRVVDLVEPDDRPRLHLLNSRAVMDPGQSQSDVFRIRHSDGTWRHIEWMSMSAMHIPEVGGLILNLRDVTRRHRSEQERQALERELDEARRLEGLGRLAGGVAHDFNNMLSVILNYATFAQRHLDEGHPLHDDMSQILLAAKRAAGMTRELMTFARLETVAPGVVDLRQVVENAQPMLDDAARGCSVHYAVGSEPAWITGDAMQFERLLVNLVANAGAATGEDGQIGVRIESVPDESRVRLLVEDDGTGMPPDVAARALDPFFTTKEEGTGLGLAVVYGIASRSGGTVDIRSSPGVGTRVEVELPTTPAPEGAPAGVHGPPSPGRGERVVIIDDEPAVLEAARRVLTDGGYVVEATDDPSRVHELVSRGWCDLVIADVVMSKRTGPEIASDARRMDPSLPILLVSGFPLRAEGDELAPYTLLTKPFTDVELLRAVRWALGSASAEAAGEGSAGPPA